MSKKLTGGGRVDTKGKYATTREPLSKTQLGKLSEKLGITSKLTPEQTKAKTLALSPKVVNQAIKGARWIGGSYVGAGAIILPQLISFIRSTMNVKTEPKSGPMRFANRGVKKPKPKRSYSNTTSAGAKDKGKTTPLKSVSVKSGDTLTALSKRHGVSLEKLKQLNPKVKPRQMQIGSRIKLR